MNIEKRRILQSIIWAILALFGAYFYNTINIPLKGDGSITQIIRDKRQEHLAENGDRVLHLQQFDSLIDQYQLINTAYDQMFVDAYRDGCLMGQEPIADRRKLLALLDTAAYYNNYRSIFIDIDFSADITPPPFDNPYADSAQKESNLRLAKIKKLNDSLAKRISAMRDIYIAAPVDEKSQTLKATFDSRMDSLVGSVHYPITIFSTNYTGTTLMLKGQKLVPMKIAEQRTGKCFKRWGPFYTFGGHLCLNNIFPSRYVDDDDLFSNSIGTVLKDSKHEDFFRDRIVVIGNMEKDIHSIGTRQRPGTTILLDTYYAILSGEHLVHWWLVIIEAIVLFCCFYAIPVHANLKEIRHGKYRSKFISELITLLKVTVTFPLIMFVLKLLVLVIFNLNINITIPVILLNIVALWNEICPPQETKYNNIIQ